VGDVLSSCRPNKTFLTSAMPCMFSKASDMATDTDDMANTALRSCDGLILVLYWGYCQRRKVR
jgi:hypothetical protein